MNSSSNSSNFYDKLTDSFSFYYTLIIPPTGLILNLFSIFIFTRKSLNKINMGFIFLIQTFADCLLILMLTVFLRSSILFGENLETASDIACKILTFSRRFFVHLSSWITVYITFDRFMFIKFPNRFAFLQDKKYIAIIIISIAMFLFLVDLESIFFFVNEQKTFENNTTIIKKQCSALHSVSVASDIITIVFRSYLPLLLMLIIDIILVRHVFEAKRKLTKSKLTSRKQLSFTLIVILSNFAFFTFNFPLSIAYILSNIYNYSGIKVESSYFISFNFYFQLAVYFSFLYQNFSFFIYFSFNSLFREEVLNLFRAKENKKTLSTYYS
jgi:hypothetical protein